jgi:hypothetical protein
VRRFLRGELALVWLAAVLTASPAAGADLTGTWEGKLVCKRLDDEGRSREVDRFVDLEISQTGNQLVAMDRFTRHFSGIVVDDASKPDRKGETALAACALGGTAGGGNSLGVLRVTVDPVKGRGRIQGTLHHIITRSIFETCTWRFRRLDTADPAVPACP